jgi:hypothetical protein
MVGRGGETPLVPRYILTVFKKGLALGVRKYTQPRCHWLERTDTIILLFSRIWSFEMRVLLFDIDGTLIDAGGAGQAAMEKAVAIEFGETRPVKDIPAAGRTDRAIGRDLFEYYSIPATDENWSRYLDTYFSLLPDSLPTQPGSVLPGVHSLIDHLSQREDVFLGLLTGNFARGAHLKLQHYGPVSYTHLTLPTSP